MTGLVGQGICKKCGGMFLVAFRDQHRCKTIIKNPRLKMELNKANKEYKTKEIKTLIEKLKHLLASHSFSAKTAYSLSTDEAESLLSMAEENERLRKALEKIKETYDTAYPSSFSELRTTMNIIEDITEEALKDTPKKKGENP